MFRDNKQTEKQTILILQATVIATGWLTVNDYGSMVKNAMKLSSN